MNSAMKQLAAERAARNGSALPRQTPKPAPQGTRVAFTGQRVKAEPKPKKNPATDQAPTPPPPPQLIVRVRQADGTVRRVAFDDGAASLDDLRAESGADELFADEACTQPCTAADLVHGAVVYARHNDAMAEDEEVG